jgi:hypothetical protein
LFSGDTVPLWRYRLPQDNTSCGESSWALQMLQRPFLNALERESQRVIQVSLAVSGVSENNAKAGANSRLASRC